MWKKIKKTIAIKILQSLSKYDKRIVAVQVCNCKLEKIVVGYKSNKFMIEKGLYCPECERVFKQPKVIMKL